MPKKSKKQIALDPIFPISALQGLGVPEIKQGEGRTYLSVDTPVDCGLPYRSFYLVWEQVERRAAENYPKYVGLKNLDDVAQAWLDALIWFRQQANPEEAIKRYSEEEAQAIRVEQAPKKKTAAVVKRQIPVSEAAKPTCPEEDGCGSDRVIKSTVSGQKKWKCEECGYRWPRIEPGDPSTKPSKAIEEPVRTHKAGKKKDKAEKRKKKSKKEKKKAQSK